MLILFLVAAIAAMAAAMRKTVARAAVGSTIVFLLLLAFLFVNGRPMLGARIGGNGPPIAKSAVGKPLRVHRAAGYAANAAFALAWAAAFVSMVRSDANRPLRLLLRSVGAVLALGLMLLSDVSGYMLAPAPDPGNALRFAVLHALFAPALTALLLILLTTACLREL